MHLAELLLGEFQYVVKIFVHGKCITRALVYISNSFDFQICLILLL